MALLPPRRDIQIPFGTARVAAWLYPSPVASSTKPGPAIVCGHGLGAVKEMGLDKCVVESLLRMEQALN